MTLSVSLEEFPAAAARVLKQKEAYVSSRGSGSIATAAGDGKLVVAVSKLAPELVMDQLKTGGMSVHPGTWRLGGEHDVEDADNLYVAAVAYSTNEEKPGLWMDAFS